MTKNQFLQAKLNSFVPEFKHLIGLNRSEKTSELKEFMTMLHPNQDNVSNGYKGEVFGNKHYSFILFETGILRTVVETGAKRFYPYKP